MKKDKPKNEEPHDTMDEYCCACEYDIAVMQKQIDKAYKQGRKEAKNS